ncbi:Rhodanese-like domain-containing protein [Giardia muris]|uniref:Rhodanese-like domain-containing protein n=1 Tax=Giardia muris TaxID=5742 RepID=A0A4Z1SZC0_GIAMU|nr:Rhodanese-like domain-containing protein [Giardia muris]|eukprot:TNJ30105.1 Rhodanese-like domain-containing protein [Giardia muris]
MFRTPPTFFGSGGHEGGHEGQCETFLTGPGLGGGFIYGHMDSSSPPTPRRLDKTNHGLHSVLGTACYPQHANMNTPKQRALVFDNQLFITADEFIKCYSHEHPCIELDPTVLLVDCRWPYEFEGGHIRGAINCVTVDDLLASVDCLDYAKVILYCEYSVRRSVNVAQTLSHTLQDDSNAPNNDILVLNGGYSAFYTEYTPYCDPLGYISETDVRFIDERRKHTRTDSRLDTWD